MSWTEILAWSVIVVLVCLPPRWDPAVRFKEWIEKKRRKGD